MKILLSWLKNFIEIEQSPAQIAKTLTMAGLEVDAIEDLSPGCEGVVVCKVDHVERHPQADKLVIAKVYDGQDTYEVVCGAPNCRPGIKTALAKIGATVLDDDGKPFKIKKSKIRGVESSGMLCAPIELGLKGSEGIIEFADHVKEGIDVAGMYGDVVFDISLTPNLGHCSSVLGVARELSASLDLPLNHPKNTLKETDSLPIASQIAVEVQSPEACPRYACRLIKSVKIGPSPEWLSKRLENCGIRSINNVVDVTNYVMLEVGHPLHAFDYQKIAGQRLIIRNASQGELFTTLDGKERVLEKSDLLICDGNKPVALAGVMGGSNSEVSDATTDVLLEAASFDPIAIRKTSKRLGLMTDASKRFERGSDPNILETVLNRSASLIQEIAGGDVCAGIIDIAHKKFPKKKIKCRLSRLNKLLGTHIAVSEVEDMFHRLEMETTWDGVDEFQVSVPTYRNDIHEEIDLVEEAARIFGYDNIISNSCQFRASIIPHSPIFTFERTMRARLVSEGLQEFLTCDLIGPSLIEVVQGDNSLPPSTVKVLNPTSVEQSILRTSLLPGLLQVVKYNCDHQNHNIAGFEIGRIHFKENEQYQEQTVAAIILSGKARSQHWDVKALDFDFFDLKGIVENILAELKVPNIAFKSSNLSCLHSGRQAAIYSGDLMIGTIGQIHPAVLRRLDLTQNILFGEINLHDLFQVQSKNHKMQPIPIFPGSERDWTLPLQESVPIADIFKAIDSTRSKFLESASLLDIYRSDKLGAGIKNVTLRFVYRDKEKTIDQEKVDSEHARLVDHVLKSIKT